MYDSAAEDLLIPHPVYGAQGWVAVVRPGPRTDDLLRRLISDAHQAGATLAAVGAARERLT